VVWASTGPGRQSVTYGGSSGSPIFNQDGLIVGTLTGGGSYCSTPNSPDYYGKFSYHWDKYAQKFQTYLDPDTTGTLVLQGYDPNGFVLEGKPVAIDADEITPVGFTANWNHLENAKKYFLDVYQKLDGDSIYLDGFRTKEIGNDTSYTITGLEHETEYWYVVRAGYGNQITEPSNEISVTTDPPTFEYFYPIATEATAVGETSFTANWEELPEATSYLLNVYKKIEPKDFTDEVDFTNWKVPEGWTKNTISYFSQENQYGKAEPAICLGNNEYVASPDYVGKAVKSLQFWYRGISTGMTNSLVVSGYVGGEWKEVKRVRPLTRSNEGETISIPLSGFPEGCTAIKILHERSSGNVALDDIVLNYGTFFSLEYVGDFEKYSVEHSLSQVVNELEDHSSYYYSIIGYNGEKYSNLSNEIEVTTRHITDTKKPSLQAATDIRSDKNFIRIHTEGLNNANVVIFNLVGQAVVSRPMRGQDLQISRQGLPSGIYFVKIGTETHKVLLR
jgi:hypothetical protein